MTSTTILRTCGALFLAVAFFALGCQDDDAGVTGASSMAGGGETARFETTAASTSRSGPEHSTSEDDPSDDTSEDDTSDDASDDEDGDEAEVKGLFFGIEACPGIADCVVALRIKDAQVVVTSETEIVNQADGNQIVLPADLQSLIDGHLGLPLKAEGTSEGGVLVARKIRIQGEIRATGDVVPGAAGCDFGLAVRGEDLCFALSAGMTTPALGATVRVEGLVPSDFSLPFVATRVQRSDD